MDIEQTSYDHGWNACRVCHKGRAQSRHDRWLLTANPGYWGDSNPGVLVLGFSKGANQVGAIERLPFDEVAFKGRRPALQSILGRLGLRFENQTIHQSMTALGRGFGYASLIRCSLAQEKQGVPITSGTIIPDAVADSWSSGVIRECVRQHLVPMPASVKRVVLLSNDGRYVAAVRALIREQFEDFQDINPMAFTAAGRRWVFVVHPAAKGAHVPNWLDGPGDEGQTEARTSHRGVRNVGRSTGAQRECGKEARNQSSSCVSPRLIAYVVKHNYGFAPNPYGGFLTLATCKPGIRDAARVGDVLLGTGSVRNVGRGALIYAGRVSEIVTTDAYGDDPRFEIKRPVVGHGKERRLGDNIYHRTGDRWIQRVNPFHDASNLSTDLSSLRVLVCAEFWYFGDTAPDLAAHFPDVIKKGPGWRYTLDTQRVREVLTWLGGFDRGVLGQPSRGGGRRQGN